MNEGMMKMRRRRAGGREIVISPHFSTCISLLSFVSSSLYHFSWHQPSSAPTWIRTALPLSARLSSSLHPQPPSSHPPPLQKTRQSQKILRLLNHGRFHHKHFLLSSLQVLFLSPLLIHHHLWSHPYPLRLRLPSFAPHLPLLLRHL